MGRRASTVAGLALAAALAGCPSGGPQEMLETARLEEVQDNLDHAREIYAAILDRYPDSPQADVARARLDALSDPD